jgi:hypothetical protein
MALTIKINKMRDLSEKNQDLIRRACKKGEDVLNWRIWEERIIRSKYTETNGKSGEQILSLIKTGADDEQRIPDGDIDIDITGFFRLTGTIGYTYLNSYRTWVNRRFLGKFSEAEVFGHIMHEFMHRAFGFTHDIAHSTSVPYRVGYISRDSFEEFYNKPLLDFHLLMSFTETPFTGTLPLLENKLQIKIES